MTKDSALEKLINLAGLKKEEINFHVSEFAYKEGEPVASFVKRVVYKPTQRSLLKYDDKNIYILHELGIEEIPFDKLIKISFC